MALFIFAVYLAADHKSECTKIVDRCCFFSLDKQLCTMFGILEALQVWVRNEDSLIKNLYGRSKTPVDESRTLEPRQVPIKLNCASTRLRQVTGVLLISTIDY